MEGLDKIKRGLEKLVGEDRLAEAFARLLEALPEKSPQRRAVLLLKSRMKSAEKKRAEGTMSDEKVERALNRIRSALLKLIGGLEVSDFDPGQLPSRLSQSGKVKQGSILHRIPGQMELLKETRCLVRIALDEKTLLENISLDEHSKIESLRIADAMEVELADPDKGDTFSIRNVNRTKQFIDEDAPTQWLFYVRPLRQGVFPLILKVAVIEKVQGEECRREAVFERTIDIVAGPAEEAEEAAFERAGFSFNYYTTSTIAGIDAVAVTQPEAAGEEPFLMQVEDVFTLRGRGTVVTGRIVQGAVRAGSTVEIVGEEASGAKPKALTATAVELFRKMLDEEEEEDDAIRRLLLRGIRKGAIQRGMLIRSPGAAHARFIAELRLPGKVEGGWFRAVHGGYQPRFYFGAIDMAGQLKLPGSIEMAMPGDSVTVEVELAQPLAVEKGLRFAIREGGRTLGAGKVTKVLK